jgi:hypothetical protein
MLPEDAQAAAAAVDALRARLLEVGNALADAFEDVVDPESEGWPGEPDELRALVSRFAMGAPFRKGAVDAQSIKRFWLQNTGPGPAAKREHDTCPHCGKPHKEHSRCAERAAKKGSS